MMMKSRLRIWNGQVLYIRILCKFNDGVQVDINNVKAQHVGPSNSFEWLSYFGRKKKLLVLRLRLKSYLRILDR